MASLAQDGYVSDNQPFAIINNTQTNLDKILASLKNLSYSTFTDETQLLNSPHGSLAGFVFNKWSSTAVNEMILLYNDSALLGLPYLINKLTNFYAEIDGTPTINASISAWPKTTLQASLDSFDASSFSALIVLGTGLILPLTSFAVEIVHDREV